MLSGSNGALVQIVMSSRVAYGMSGQGNGTAYSGNRPSEVAYAGVCNSADERNCARPGLGLPLESLAKVTSGIMLVNFAFVNAALVRLKLRAKSCRMKSFSFRWHSRFGLHHVHLVSCDSGIFGADMMMEFEHT